ncbi:CBS domain-containing protein [Oscillochloris sp. ZM17-4]|uniref:CBS domain-containing protein n=1 Tax=Oscillochloris sp. ZM17-4 TaxID=2866714 RepID=UPI001C72ECA8|nr:CBS domain-containing protein [Oscillochloris sp. ZM17-4]MBX0326430.1 CBS domain-containing protein [Oscillochloris sp. ZM17-4]
MDTVKVWMSSPAIIARDTETLPHARDMLAAEGIRRLPVVNTAGELVGIVTEGDINRISDSPDSDVQEYNLYYRIHDLPLREIMRRPVITVTPDTPLHEAAHLMIAWRISGLPVLEHGHVTGVITVSDMLRRIIWDTSDTASNMLNERTTGFN